MAKKKSRQNERRRVVIRKTVAAVCAFAAGVCTAPLAAVAWPLVLAWFAFNEEEP